MQYTHIWKPLKIDGNVRTIWIGEVLTLQSGDGEHVHSLYLHMHSTILQGNPNLATLAVRVPELVNKYFSGSDDIPILIRWPPEGVFGPVMYLGLFDAESKDESDLSRSASEEWLRLALSEPDDRNPPDHGTRSFQVGLAWWLPP
jgi:hypothetical protein